MWGLNHSEFSGYNKTNPEITTYFFIFQPMLVQGHVGLSSIARIIFQHFFSDSPYNFWYIWLWEKIHFEKLGIFDNCN
jgi:hypothetical protein